MSEASLTAGFLPPAVDAAERRDVRSEFGSFFAATAPVRAMTWLEKYRLILTVVDAGLIVLALLATSVARFGEPLDLQVAGTAVSYPVAGLLIGVVWLVALGAVESRALPVLGAGLEEYRRVLSATTYTFGFVAIVSYLAQAQLSRLFFATLLPVGGALLLVGRWVCRSTLNTLRGSGRALTPTLIVGALDDVRATLGDMRRHPEAGFRPVAVSITSPLQGATEGSSPLEGVDLVPFQNVVEHVHSHELGAVTVAGGVTRPALRRLAWSLENSRVQLMFVPRLADVSGPRLSVRAAEGLGLVHVDLPRYSGFDYWLKRTFDLAFATVALVLLSPFLGAIALTIKLGDGGPILFRQERVGRGGGTFTIHKFRTMAVDAEARLEALRSQSQGNGVLFKLEDDPRVTRVGRFLRKYSLDELPQFWTVLRGQMSVVGPRPHLARELAEFPQDGLRRLLIKPGITGLWQVSGRSDLDLEDSIRLDLQYVANWSLAGDVAIVLKTIRAVTRTVGAY